MIRLLHLALGSLLCSFLLGCASDQQNYCENISDCAQGGSNDWIMACEHNLAVAQSQATNVGCTTQFNAYYSCTSANFTCNGNTPAFPGCDAPYGALNQCLAGAQQGTACAALAAATSACPGDAGVASCSATRDCEAQCYLDNVTNNVCAPDVGELELYTACAATCP